MIEIPTNNCANSAKEKLVEEVLSQLQSGDSAYIDWGATCDIYKNCPNLSIAREVAQMFKDKGYFVYYDMCGNKYGEPTEPGNIRIYSSPQEMRRLRVEF